MRPHPIGLDRHDLDGHWLYADSPVVTPDQAWEHDNEASWDTAVPWEIVEPPAEQRRVRAANRRLTPKLERRLQPSPYQSQPPPVFEPPPPDPWASIRMLGDRLRVWVAIRPPMASWPVYRDNGFRGRQP